MNVKTSMVDVAVVRKGHDVLAESYIIKHLFDDSETWDGSCGVCSDDEHKLVIAYVAGWNDGYAQGVEENKPPF